VSDTLSIYTIFHNPEDAPGMFVTRRFEVVPEGGVPREGWLAASLEEARVGIPPGLALFDRNEEDHPSVVESWI